MPLSLPIVPQYVNEEIASPVGQPTFTTASPSRVTEVAAQRISSNKDEFIPANLLGLTDLESLAGHPSTTVAIARPHKNRSWTALSLNCLNSIGTMGKSLICTAIVCALAATSLWISYGVRKPSVALEMASFVLGVIGLALVPVIIKLIREQSLNFEVIAIPIQVTERETRIQSV